jgi:sialate O-acetylesterase
MRPLRLHVLLTASSALIACRLGAAPELAPLFRDHAVLQRDVPVPVWGRAAPGEHVSVSFAGQSVGTTTGPDGRWITVLAPLQASAAGIDLVVTGKAAVAVHDIVVGELWLCSGQSNMEFEVDDAAAGYRVENDAAEVAAARYPLIRQFKVARQASDTPMDSVRGDWKACSPATVGHFTAVGYFFARDLFTRLGVPIGLINSTAASTPIESWMSPAALAAFPRLSNGHAAGRAAPGLEDPWVPSSVFNGMIQPLLPCAVRGVIWYQGESNVGRASEYAALFPALISAWRTHFGSAELPFFWVQLPAFKPAKPDPAGGWAALREAQAGALSVPGTGQAVAIDIGEAGVPHPRNKQEVGRRLALIAKAKVYSIPVDYSGPVFSGAVAEGAAMRVHFQFAGEGLTASGKPLQSFEVAGADRVFRPAVAVIQGDSVVARSAAVPHPVAVRYAWRDDPEANLFNGAGLPAAPFRSDDW